MGFKFENNIKQHHCLLKEFLPLVNYQNSLPEAILSIGRCWKKTTDRVYKNSEYNTHVQISEATM